MRALANWRRYLHGLTTLFKIYSDRQSLRERTTVFENLYTESLFLRLLRESATSA